jgi:hypothetical protein
MISACSTHGERRDAYRLLMEKHEGKRQLGRSGFRWETNFKVDSVVGIATRYF